MTEASRSFTRFATDEVKEESIVQTSDLIPRIRPCIIGQWDAFMGPFGERGIVYADHTASGRAVRSIENYIRDQVLPIYGNTHTSTSATGLQTTLFRDEARAIVARSVHASVDDEVLFLGSGSTAAVNGLVRIIAPSLFNQRVVIFVGPFEHHSNLLPWREIPNVEVVNVREDLTGKTGVDLEHLKEKLGEYSGVGTRLIGTFSAASNVTGIQTDVDAVTGILHDAGAWAFWDYAAAAPYVKVDMNPEIGQTADKSNKTRLQKDAVFLSPHKMLGGVGSTGVLVCKKEILALGVEGKPCNPGGGTVFYVTENSHRYLDNLREREEGGTPDIVGSIRAGLSFQLRAAIGMDSIESIESRLAELAFDRLSKINNISLLGNHRVENSNRLPIISFMVKHEGLYLHYNFVCSLLNDLFGIQARGGCACAGPYAQTLLGISPDVSDEIEEQLLKKHEIVRPGFVRLNLSYCMSSQEVEFILKSLEFVAEHAWKFLPLYGFYVDTGEWRHRTQMTKILDRRWLGDISFGDGGLMNWSSSRREIPASEFDERLTQVLADAEKYLVTEIETMNPMVYRRDMVDQRKSLPESVASLRWFMLPFEALYLLKGSLSSSDIPTAPFTVNPYQEFVEVTTKMDVDQTVSDEGVTSPTTVAKVAEKSAVCRNCFHRHTNDKVADASQVPECITCQCVDYVASRAKDKRTLKRVQIRLNRMVGRALHSYEMINEGDRVLVALSGGKDSLTMLHSLLDFQKKSPVKFTVGAVTVDPQHPEYDPKTLVKYMASLNVPFFLEEAPIMDMAKEFMDPKRVSFCSFCARMKRGKIYSTARREGYNVIAMGQHLDDMAESFLMSIFHNGCLRTMKANYHCDEGDLRIIRPLVLVRERITREYASVADLPVINENCPACYEEPKERARVKQVLAAQEHIHPNVFQSMLKAMDPLIRSDNRNFVNTIQTDDNMDNIDE